MEGTMTSAENNQLIAGVARDIVAQTEPGELPLFQAISKQYFKRPADALSEFKLLQLAVQPLSPFKIYPPRKLHRHLTVAPFPAL